MGGLNGERVRFSNPSAVVVGTEGGGDEERKRLADDVNIHDRFGQLEQCDISSKRAPRQLERVPSITLCRSSLYLLLRFRRLLSGNEC